MARGTAVESSVPDYDPALGEDIDSELPPEDGADEQAALEARAAAMGWKPLSQYRGPPGQWRDAAEFIAHGETNLPVLRDQNRRMSEKIVNLESEVGSMRRTLEEQTVVLQDMREMGRRADQRGYERAMAEINQKKGEARAAGDVEAYAQLVEQAEALEDAHDEAAPPAREPAPKTEPKPPGADPATVQFLRDNPWFNADKFLGDQMIAFEGEVAREYPDMTLSDRYVEAKARLVEKFSERFERHAPPAPRQPAPRRRATVAAPTPGGQPPPPAQAGTAINSIADPAERTQAREAFNRMKRQFDASGGTPYTEAEYMAVYDNPHADVLTVQSETRRKPNGRQ